MILPIKDFAAGLNTQDDSEDVGKFLEHKNFETDKKGLLYLRKGIASVLSSLTFKIKNIFKWTHDELTNDSEWIVHTVISDGTEKIERVDSAGTVTTVKTFSTAPLNVQITPFSDELRFGNGRDVRAGILQFIDRQFFFGGYQNWSSTSDNSDFIYDDAAPSYPTTWSYSGITSLGDGANAAGYYYYKFVPVFDGTNEMNFEDAEGYIKITGATEKTIRVHLKMNTDDFNKRITAINVYRSYNASNVEPSFYRIKTIPLNTKSDHDDKKSDITANIGKVLYAPGVDFTTFGSSYDEVVINGNTSSPYAIASKANEYITLSTAVSSSDKITDGAFTVQESEESGYTTYASGGYAGQHIALASTSPAHNDGELINWVANVSGANDCVITENYSNIIFFSRDAGTTGSSITVSLSNGYRYDLSGTDVNLYFYDRNLVDGAAHPLDGKDKIIANYKYGVYMNGRMFGLNVKLDPTTGGDNEVHKDWIVYSEFNKPDIMPIDNYIQVRDMQGGEITGGIEYINHLIVFMEKGMYVLSVPSLDPSGWTLVEAEKNIGCIANKSIIKAEGVVFFAGRDNIYAVDGNFQAQPIADDIKDDYQAAVTSDAELSYDIKKGRLICRFAAAGSTLYAFDVKRYLSGRVTTWTKISTGTVDTMITDENSIFHIVENDASYLDTKIYKFYEGSGTESVTGSFKTGHFPISTDMSDKGIVSRVNVSYTSTPDLTLKINYDRGASTVTKTLSSSGSQKHDSFRIGGRGKYAQLELTTAANSDYDTEIQKIELDVR